MGDGYSRWPKETNSVCRRIGSWHTVKNFLRTIPFVPLTMVRHNFTKMLSSFVGFYLILFYLYKKKSSTSLDQVRGGQAPQLYDYTHNVLAEPTQVRKVVPCHCSFPTVKPYRLSVPASFFILVALNCSLLAYIRFSISSFRFYLFLDLTVCFILL